MALFPHVSVEILCQKVAPILTDLITASALSHGDLSSVEEHIGKALKQIIPLVISSGLRACSEQASEAMSCPDCGLRLTVWHKRDRAIMTAYGEGSLCVRRFRCKGCKKDHYPLQVQNDLEGSHFTLGARRLIAEEASYSPYTRAAQRLEQLGIRVSSSEVDRIVEEVSELRKMEEDVVRAHLCQKGSDLPLPLHDWSPWQRCSKDIACVMSVDGAMVRSDQLGVKGLEWFEVRAGVMCLDGHEDHKICVGGFMEPDKLFETLRSQWRQSPHKNRRLVFVADGANWIWDRVRYYFPFAIEVLDIYHAAEHVGSAARACWGEHNETTTAWVKDAKGMLLKEHGVQQVIKELIAAMGSDVVNVETLRTELRYLWRNRHRMNYFWLRNQQLPVGSGVMESTIKQLATQRLRMPGMMWTRAGADQILRLRAAVLSKSLHLTIERQRMICTNRMDKFRTKTTAFSQAI
jgi:hypothetical protein